MVEVGQVYRDKDKRTMRYVRSDEYRSQIAQFNRERDDLITVCDRCLQAACWQGIFMCEDARDAGTARKTRSQLAELGRENADYWKTDEELAATPSNYDMRSMRKRKWQIAIHRLHVYVEDESLRPALERTILAAATPQTIKKGSSVLEAELKLPVGDRDCPLHGEHPNTCVASPRCTCRAALPT